ncbi:MAG: GNAT family N-acetyltransferase [candidate division WOR-3 bacterium]
MSYVQGTHIVDLDLDGLALLVLENRLCFVCSLLEDERRSDFAGVECHVRPEALRRLVADERSGVKVAVQDGRVVGYAVFGRPELFPGRTRLPFELDDTDLLIAALYVIEPAEQAGVDVELLLEIMDFARETGYDSVQAVCRTDDRPGPEGPVRLFEAAGFRLTEPIDGLARAEIGLEEWADRQETGEDESSLDPDR